MAARARFVAVQWAERAMMSARGCTTHAARGSSSIQQVADPMKLEGVYSGSPLGWRWRAGGLWRVYQHPAMHAICRNSLMQTVRGSAYSLARTQQQIRFLCAATSKIPRSTTLCNQASLRTTNMHSCLLSTLKDSALKRSYCNITAANRKWIMNKTTARGGIQKLRSLGSFGLRHYHYGPPPSWKDQLWKLAGGVLLIAFVISFFSVLVTIGTAIIGAIALAALVWFTWRKLRSVEFIRNLERNPWFSKFWSWVRGKAEESNIGRAFKDDSSMMPSSGWRERSGFSDMFPFMKVMDFGRKVSEEVDSIQQKALEMLRGSPEATRILGNVQATLPTSVGMTSINANNRYDIKFIVHGDRGYGELDVQVEKDSGDYLFLNATFSSNDGRQVCL
uniref:Uncharacterized protein n=1 Tax=Hanusia phi TaxID=3032 RepID=A0A7S0EFI8_9CRYP